MLISLVKKDFILVKKYLILMFIFAAGAPVFIYSKVNQGGVGFIVFTLTALLTIYSLFNSVTAMEYKYKAPALLCTTPYTRNSIIKAKYLFILMLFVCCFIIYTIVAVLIPTSMQLLSISTFGISLLLATLYFSIIIPVQYKFGYEKTKYISFLIIFIIPFALPTIIKFLQTHNINLKITLPFPQIIQNLLPCIIAVIIGLISMRVTMNIYSKKDL